MMVRDDFFEMTPGEEDWWLDWHLTDRDAELLRELPCPEVLRVLTARNRESGRRIGLGLRLDDLIYEFAESKAHPDVNLETLLARKGLKRELAFDLLKSEWLQRYGYNPHGRPN